MAVDKFVAERSKIATQRKADGVISSPLEVPSIMERRHDQISSS
jgi:hypothetical protein